MKKSIILGAVMSLMSSVASAHPGHGLESAYAGFMHPLTGWDHLLVMLAIGVWAAKLGGKARWQLPLTFFGVMALGAGLGLAGIGFSGLETALAASVMAMGVMLMLRLSINQPSQLAITAVFAAFHGMAHGSELQSQSGLSVFAGMLIATALLHGTGVFFGSQRFALRQWLQNGLAYTMLLVGGYLLVA